MEKRLETNLNQQNSYQKTAQTDGKLKEMLENANIFKKTPQSTEIHEKSIENQQNSMEFVLEKNQKQHKQT